MTDAPLGTVTPSGGRRDAPPIETDHTIALRPISDALNEARIYRGVAWSSGGASYFRDIWQISERERRIQQALDDPVLGPATQGRDPAEPLPPYPHAGGVEDAIGRLADAHRMASVAERRVLGELREQRAMTTATGSGAGLVPFVQAGVPVSVAAAFGQSARAKSVLPPILTTAELPPIGMSVGIPRFSTGVQVAVQASEAAAANDSSGVTLFQASPVGMVSGKVDVSQQLFDRSDPSVDAAIAAELGADFGRQLDQQILNGSGAAGQVTGLLNASGISSTTFTSASPTPQLAATQIFTSLSAVASAWGRLPTHVLVASRRYFWLLDHKDSQGLIVRPDYGATLYPTPAMPTTLGAGAEDAIVVLDASTVVLAISPVRFMVSSDVLSGTLQTRVEAMAYIALIVRNPEGVGKVTGTGLTTPTFA